MNLKHDRFEFNLKNKLQYVEQLQDHLTFIIVITRRKGLRPWRVSRVCAQLGNDSLHTNLMWVWRSVPLRHPPEFSAAALTTDIATTAAAASAAATAAAATVTATSAAS